MKTHKSCILLLCFSIIFSLTSLSHAENKTFVKEYTYQASEIDSKVSCRTIAFEQLKRLLLEELGTYLESMTEVKNFQLTKDQITTLTAGIVGAEIISEKWDGVSYYMKAKITADPQEVATSVDKLRHDTQKTKELEETKKKAQEYYSELQQLRKELETAKLKNPQQATNTTLIKDYNAAVKGLNATELYQKAHQLQTAGEQQEAFNYYNKAIELNPKYASAYTGRGLVYYALGDHNQAINDYNKAIEINPDATTYNNRGVAYYVLGDKNRAESDYTRAVRLDPRFADAYFNRGLVYDVLGDHNQAISDYNKAIEINPKHVYAYYNRGLVYYALGDKKQAESDYIKAVKLDPNYASRPYKK
jgi:tetratricopeptide (TPR) repeat protein